jgi:hypothetical protein
MSNATPNPKLEPVTRCVKIDNWIFEIKSVRAIRVDEYGRPYSAIATMNINGDKAYIDGLMTSSNSEFSREDVAAFKAYLQQLDVMKAEFNRYKNKETLAKSLDIPPLKKVPSTLTLVS